jgi:chemotaxis-related protein WspB
MKGEADQRLLLLFSAGDDLYACDAEPIIEVVPLVKLKEIPKSPNYIAGLLNYGGQPIPVINFCELVRGQPAQESLHTRIILFSNPDSKNGELTALGLIAEKVTETTSLNLNEFVDTGMRIQNLPYLGGVLSTQNETVQLMQLDKFFDAMQEIVIYSGVER